MKIFPLSLDIFFLTFQTWSNSAVGKKLFNVLREFFVRCFLPNLGLGKKSMNENLFQMSVIIEMLNIKNKNWMQKAAKFSVKRVI